MAYKFQKGTFKPAGPLDLGSTGASAADSIVLAAGAIENDDLAAISAANKVEAGSIELAGTTALEDNSGLQLKAALAGDGLAMNSQVLSVNVDDSSIETNSDTLRVKASGITNDMLAGSIANGKLANSTISGVALGGNLSALAVDDSSIEYSSGTAFNGSAASTIQVKASGITNAMLAGSIANAKLVNSAITIGGASTSLGGTVTSATILAAGILNNVGAATSDYSLNGQKITNLGTPGADSDAATKAYVDGVASGLDVKKSVRAASAANIAGTYNNGAGTITAASNGALPAQDGVTMGTGQRLLLKNQTDATQNGIYVVTNPGGVGAAYVLTRATDMDEVAEITPGLFTFVEEGTLAQNQGFVLTTNKTGSIAIGTDDLDFAQFSGAGSITAGTGLGQSGNTISVAAAQTSITSIFASEVKIGEDDETKIHFSGSNRIQFYANNQKQITLEQNSFKFDAGALFLKVREVANATALDQANGQMIIVNPSSDGVTVTLPQIAGNSLAGLMYTIKNRHATRTVVVATHGGTEDIEESSSSLTLQPGAAINCVCDGARWHVY